MATYKNTLDDAALDGRRAAASAQSAAESVQDAAENVRQKAGEAQEAVRRKVGEAQEAVKSATADVAEKGQEALTATRDGAYALGDVLKQTIERQPVAAVAVAALIGFVIGVANRR